MVARNQDSSRARPFGITVWIPPVWGGFPKSPKIEAASSSNIQLQGSGQQQQAASSSNIQLQGTKDTYTIQHAAYRIKLFAREAIRDHWSLSPGLQGFPKMSNLHYNHNVKTSGSRVSICSHLHYNHNVKTSGSGVSRVQSTL